MHVEPKVSVFIVDDHELVREGLRQLINAESDLEICGDAANVKEVMQLKKSIAPDVAIVDISLPDGSGLDVVKNLHIWRPEMRIVILSMHDDELFAERAIKYGAMAYINKQDSAEKLLIGIREVLKNKFYFSPEVTERLLRRMSNQTPSVDLTPLSQLSDRELQVYESIGRGKKTKEIASDLNLSIKTIETYRSNIKKKLKLESGSDLTRSAIVWFMENQ